MKRRPLLLFIVCLCLADPTSPAVAQAASRPELTEIFATVRELRQPKLVDGIPDYSAAAVDEQKTRLADLKRRFDRIDPAGWPVADQVDYLIVRSELDTLDYGLNVYRATSRSPNFYLSSISSFGMSSGATLSRLGQLVQLPPPFDRQRAREILDHMRNIPRILEQAKRNLTEPTKEMSRWALPTLANAEDSSRAFAEGLGEHFPPELRGELDAAALEMGASLTDFRAWIEARLPSMPSAEPLGREMYDWILKRIWLLPYDAEDILRMGEQEYARYLSFTAFEEARNEGLPRPQKAATTAEYAARTEADALAIREFLTRRNALTIPDFVGPYRRTEMPAYIQAFSLWAGLSGYRTQDNGAVKYSVPEDHPYTETYWESIMRVDASTNIFHDGIPGHHFQGLVSARHPSPIRARHRDRVKSEGWSTYWEETAVQLGFYDDRPRSRELIYSFMRLRALRVIVDVKMALGEMTVDEAVAALMTVPMDRRIASEEADDFFAAPTGGIVYLVGKLQIERLLTERRRQLGDRFSLRTFHDDLVAAAWVPIELTRWEMTGAGEHARRMIADREPMPWRAPEPSAVQSEEVAFRVEEVAEGLQIPWAIAFLPDGRALVTERNAGRIVVVDIDSGGWTPTTGGPDDVFIKDNAGMLDVVLHPEFAANRWVYYCYTAGDARLNTMVVERARFEGNALVDRERIFAALPWYHNSIVYGCRLAFDDESLFVTMGDRWDLRHLSQSPGSHLGKVLKMTHDGRAPADNPFVGVPGAMPEVFSLGNRNAQGLAVHPVTGELWEHEHGPQGGDEVNVIEAGRNYGWPVVTHGLEYSGEQIGESLTEHEGMEPPVHTYVPSIAPSDMFFYTGSAFPEWRGDLFIGALALHHVNRLVIDGRRVVREVRLLEEQEWRIRCVEQGPDDLIYLGTDDGKILRLVPVRATP